MVLKMDHSTVSNKELQDKIKKYDKKERGFAKCMKRMSKVLENIFGTGRQRALVEVSMLRTDWVFRDRERGELKNFDKLIKALAESPSDSMYNTDFVITIVDEFWSLYQTSIFITVFIPFIVYFFCTNYYFSFFLAIPIDERHPELDAGDVDQLQGSEKILVCLIFILTAFFTAFEFS